MSVISRLDALNYGAKTHAHGVFSSNTLKKIEAILPKQVERSCETGCGKTTILFSNISKSHTVFAFDDMSLGDNSSVRYYRDCPITQKSNVAEIFGATQETLPFYKHLGLYNIVLLDGPHGYPFPELEYYFLYPHIQEGGILIVDDVHIPTVGRLADFLREDDMWEMIQIVDFTALFRRTSAPLFDPKADGWWLQKFNTRRVPPWHDLRLNDGGAQKTLVGSFD